MHPRVKIPSYSSPIIPPSHQKTTLPTYTSICSFAEFSADLDVLIAENFASSVNVVWKCTTQDACCIIWACKIVTELVRHPLWIGHWNPHFYCVLPHKSGYHWKYPTSRCTMSTTKTEDFLSLYPLSFTKVYQGKRLPVVIYLIAWPCWGLGCLPGTGQDKDTRTETLIWQALTGFKKLTNNPFSRPTMLHNKVVECEFLDGKCIPSKNLVKGPLVST